MNAEELVEAVSKMTPGPWFIQNTRKGFGVSSCAGHVAYTSTQSKLTGPEANASGIVALRNHAVRLLQSLISERDAALARVAELEAWRESAFVTYPNLDLDIESTPNVRDAGPTPYSGRTTRRDEG